MFQFRENCFFAICVYLLSQREREKLRLLGREPVIKMYKWAHCVYICLKRFLSEMFVNKDSLHACVGED